MGPAFINPTCIIWFFIVCVILAILYVLRKILQGPRPGQSFPVKRGSFLHCSSNSGLQGNVPYEKNTNKSYPVTKVKVRKTLISRMPLVKRMDDNVRTVMTGLLRLFRSNDMKMENSLTADKPDLVQVLFSDKSTSDIKISELEGRVLNGLDISCIVEDSRRIIVAYRKKY